MIVLIKGETYNSMVKEDTNFPQDEILSQQWLFPTKV